MRSFAHRLCPILICQSHGEHPTIDITCENLLISLSYNMLQSIISYLQEVPESKMRHDPSSRPRSSDPNLLRTPSSRWFPATSERTPLQDIGRHGAWPPKHVLRMFHKQTARKHPGTFGPKRGQLQDNLSWDIRESTGKEFRMLTLNISKCSVSGLIVTKSY